MTRSSMPKAQGLYDPRHEHDACGIGAVVSIPGHKSHEIVELGKTVLVNLMHRGAAGADDATGDGAGILTQVPHNFLRVEAARAGVVVPATPTFAVAMLFLPQAEEVRRGCEALLCEALQAGGVKPLGWRDVPTDNATLGEIARTSEPVVRQLFLEAPSLQSEEFERRLFVVRKRVERRVRERYGDAAEQFYVISMSARTICYKGMFMAPQLFAYYPDLADERFTTALAVVHQRYSTNTFPSWKLAQPFRMIAHNGEINTLSGNRAGVQAYEPLMQCPELADDLSDMLPMLEPNVSDSASFDNVMELLVRAGRTAPHALMMMAPEAFGPKYHISEDKRAFYEYHSAIMAPWDGPAALVFTDGRLVGGTLDRNGLRPSRYVITTDDVVVLASEVGVKEFAPEQIRQKGRLQPGKMFLVDTQAGRIVVDNEVKAAVARRRPYRRWLQQNVIELRGLCEGARPADVTPGTLSMRLRAFGYTREDLALLIAPMAESGQEPVGSMGTDTPLAVLSRRPKLLFNYFKQMFAQVTNPPIDPLREGLVMSLMTFAGKQRNLLSETPEHCRQLKLKHPILTNEDMELLRSFQSADFKVATIPALFAAAADDPGRALRYALEELVEQGAAAIRDGASLLIVSDRGVSPQMAPIPSLLAMGALHHGLLRRGLRAEVGLVSESGEPREIMHFCLLCGYGANAINPYLAFETLSELQEDGDLPKNQTLVELTEHYIKAVNKGLLKTMSKMGISTLRSYRQAQLFEAIGLDREVIDEYLTGTPSRIAGVGLDVLAKEALDRHAAAFGPRDPAALPLDFGGEYHFRLDGEAHLWSPQAITRLQHAVLYEDSEAYEDFARAINDQSRELCTLRGLFEFIPGEPVPLDEVEPVAAILPRFNTGAMSHGSISREAHETLAIAMNRIGGCANTGEGGEDPQRYVPLPNGDSLSCSIKQVASARFGVTIEYLANAKILQIKMAQGAKPGEGGQLPGAKVTEEIARLRYATPGVSLISPPPHHDIYSIEDLAQLIYDLKCANPGVLVSVKLVSEVGVGTIAAGVAKGNADEVLISGHDGGTGASPWSSIKYAGIPWELGLAETQQTLLLNGLRDRIIVQVDGQMKTGRDVVIGALLGAERYGFGTAALVSLGCILMRKCHKGTCPVGIATQDLALRKRFHGKAEYVIRYLTYVAEEARRLMAQLGFRTFDEMIGRVDRLGRRKAVEHWKAHGLDLAAIFAQPKLRDKAALRRVRPQPDRHQTHLDWTILAQVEPALARKESVRLELPIRNVHRTVGAIVSNRIVTQYGAAGLPDGAMELVFHGSAGQSFGAFLAKGVTLRLIGDSNDYLGKGLSGGRIVVQTPPGSLFAPEENVIVGNTLLYGATAGEVFINGVTGERFAVRNSGATAVVEGVGDHGCEYMTGGRVIVLGQTGRNFAAGMSGGIAYVLDEQQLFDTLCNLEMVDLEPLEDRSDIRFVRDWIALHYRWTRSALARRILHDWRDVVGKFVKVIPMDYRKALERLRENERPEYDEQPSLADEILATEEVTHG